jgi:hypothetical protein
VTAAQERTGGATFTLAKEWLDPVDGIEMVEVRYCWGPPGAEPVWDGREQSQVAAPQDDGRPARRVATLELPRPDGDAEYLLHHFFFVVRQGARATTPVFTERIAGAPVGCDDPAGDYTHVGVVWQVGDSPERNYATLALDGLPLPAGAGPEFGTYGSIFEFVRAVPLPHHFSGRVWGVVGQPVRYVLHLVRSGSPDPAQDFERWDDNDGAGYWSRI